MCIEIYNSTCRDIDDPMKCVKCGDTFKCHYGGKSKRTQCRVHNWTYTYEEKNTNSLLRNPVKWCKTCKRRADEIGSRNCYHCYYYE